MRLDNVCGEIVADVFGCLGCAVVDLDTGLPLAMRVVPGRLLSEGAMEVMAAACVDYFRGRAIWQLELTMSGRDGASPTGYVREIQTSTEDTYHFMSVMPGHESTLLILITDKTTNLGQGWIATRQALARIAGAALGQQRVPDAARPAQPMPAQAPAQPAPAQAPQRFQDRGMAHGVATDHGDIAAHGQPADPPALDNFEVQNPRWRGGRGRRSRLH